MSRKSQGAGPAFAASTAAILLVAMRYNVVVSRPKPASHAPKDPMRALRSGQWSASNCP